MGRSSAEQASRNRARIVESASGLFRERGVEAVSVAEIMASASMTVGGFYKHFPSKDALVQEACALAFDQATEAWQEVARRSEARPRGRAATIVRHYFKEKSAHHTCPLLAFAPRPGEAEQPVAAEASWCDGANALLAQFLAATGDEGLPEAEARLLFAAMIGAKFLARASDGADWALNLQAAVADRAVAAA